MCGGDCSRGQWIGPQEAKLGSVEPPPGPASQPGFGPGPGGESQLWHPGSGWSGR